MYQIITGGCNTRHPSSFFMSHPDGLNNYLLLIVKTPAVFQIAGQDYTLSPNQAIILAPHTPCSYSNPYGEYMDDWLHIAAEEDIFPLRGILATNTFFRVDDAELFSVYIRQLLWENAYTTSQYRTENIDCLVNVLLNHLLIAYQQKDLAAYYNPYFPKLQEIRISMKSTLMDPLSIDDVSKRLGISKSHFQHLYTELFGISFQKDYIQMRIDYAKDLIETTDLPMEQIAELCGYSTEVHFYRQFKAYTDLTPAVYRRKFRNQLF